MTLCWCDVADRKDHEGRQERGRRDPRLPVVGRLALDRLLEAAGDRVRPDPVCTPSIPGRSTAGHRRAHRRASARRSIPEGKYLYFISRRTLDPEFGTFELNMQFSATDRIYVATLREGRGVSGRPAERRGEGGRRRRRRQGQGQGRRTRARTKGKDETKDDDAGQEEGRAEAGRWSTWTGIERARPSCRFRPGATEA